MTHILTKCIDYFHPPFKRIMPVVTFRYAVCGSVNTMLGLIMYYIFYHFVFNQSVFELGFIAFKPHIAALLVSGSFTFCFGFVLNKFLVFVESNIKGRVQLFRYFLSFAFNLFFNFVVLKLLVEVCKWGAFVSQVATTILVILISYITQKYFTFRTK